MIIAVPTSLLEDTPRLNLRDMFPRFATSAKPVSYCYHEYPDGDPTPRKNRRFICPKCGTMLVAQKVRLPREPKSTCYECGHTTPKGPKLPKVWQWAEVQPA